MDRRLKRGFAEGHEVFTVAEAGWAGKKNGELLRLAAPEFDVPLSMDKGILHRTSPLKVGSVALVMNRLLPTTPEGSE